MAAVQRTCAFIDNLWQTEVWERLAPQLGIKNLVLLACSHRQLNMILIEDSIWQASLRSSVDLTFDVVLCPEEGLTWRYLAMQVVEGLGCLGCPGAEVIIRACGGILGARRRGAITPKLPRALGRCGFWGGALGVDVRGVWRCAG